MKSILIIFLSIFLSIGSAFSQENQILNKKELINAISASGDYGLIPIQSKGISYNLHDYFSSIPIKKNISESNPHFYVFNVEPDNVCGYKFAVINGNGEAGWVVSCEMQFSDFDLARAIGYLNGNDNIAIKYKSTFINLFDIDLDDILSQNNPFINQQNKEKYTTVNDTSYTYPQIKLFFGFDCEPSIKEFVREKDHTLINNGVIQKRIIKQKNILKIKITNENVSVNKLEISFNDLEQAIIDFLDNGGISSQWDGYCEYCLGERNPRSSDSPQEAFIEIQNFSDYRWSSNRRKTYDIIRQAYSYLWKNVAYKQGITEFEKVDCEIRKNIIEKHYPINIIYSPKDLTAFRPPPPLPPSSNNQKIKNN